MQQSYFLNSTLHFLVHIGYRGLQRRPRTPLACVAQIEERSVQTRTAR
jgi:hypothetical protein